MLADTSVDEATKSEIGRVIQRFDSTGQGFWLEGRSGTIRPKDETDPVGFVVRHLRHR